MALSDLSVYSEFAYTTATEVLTQQVELFNAASQGTITLGTGAMLGDYSDKLLWKKISGLVKRRNAYGTGAQTNKKLQNLTDTMVKVAAGMNTVEINPGQFAWIKKNPQEAGLVLGKQLAGDMLADMLNTAILAGYAAMKQTSAILYDATSDTPDTLTHAAMLKAAAKFGDRASDIRAWITHSLPMFNLWNNNMTNTEKLFLYETVAVNRDAFGRVFVVTDTSSLIDTAPTPDVYYLLGLVQGAINVENNGDYMANEETKNGDENILRTLQAEWSYNLGVKGYAWDKTNGGHSPTDAAIGTSTNWDKYATSDKDGPGVILKVDFA